MGNIGNRGIKFEMKKRRIFINKFICLSITLIFITGISNLLYGEDSSFNRPLSDLQLNNYPLINLNSSLFEKNVDFNEGEYKESSFRRFEIIFFISLPISFLLTLGGTLLYKATSGNKGNFSGIEYRYIALSSVGISISVALRDYFLTKKSIEK